jgi:nucleoside 2-deoxyribosyltransferase
LAARIARELRRHDVEPVDASGIAVGGNLRESVKSAIRGADAFVLVVTDPESAAASWTSYELGMAEAMGKPILLLLSQNHSAAQLPSDLAGLPIAAVDPERPESMGREIVDRLLAAA